MGATVAAQGVAVNPSVILIQPNAYEEEKREKPFFFLQTSRPPPRSARRSHPLQKLNLSSLSLLQNSANVQPQGVQVAPFLIAVSPLGCVFFVFGFFFFLEFRKKMKRGKGRLTLSLAAPFFFFSSPTAFLTHNSVGVQPQGVNVAPNGIVVGPVGKAYTPQVRKRRRR